MDVRYTKFATKLELSTSNKGREAKGRETLHAQVPSPAHVSKSQHGGQVPTFEPQETIEMWFTFIEVGS